MARKANNPHNLPDGKPITASVRRAFAEMEADALNWLDRRKAGTVPIKGPNLGRRATPLAGSLARSSYPFGRAGAESVRRSLGVVSPFYPDRDATIARASLAAKSIVQTTQDDLADAFRRVRREMAKEGLDRSGPVARERTRAAIREVFSKAKSDRAPAIGELEASNATHTGAAEAAKELSAGGTKKWLTDANPCDRCASNAAAGPIPISETFPAGADVPPQHMRCRCGMSFDGLKPVQPKPEPEPTPPPVVEPKPQPKPEPKPIAPPVVAPNLAADAPAFKGGISKIFGEDGIDDRRLGIAQVARASGLDPARVEEMAKELGRRGAITFDHATAQDVQMAKGSVRLAVDHEGKAYHGFRIERTRKYKDAMEEIARSGGPPLPLAPVIEKTAPFKMPATLDPTMQAMVSKARAEIEAAQSHVPGSTIADRLANFDRGNIAVRHVIEAGEYHAKMIAAKSEEFAKISLVGPMQATMSAERSLAGAKPGTKAYVAAQKAADNARAEMESLKNRKAQLRAEIEAAKNVERDHVASIMAKGSPGHPLILRDGPESLRKEIGDGGEFVSAIYNPKLSNKDDLQIRYQSTADRDGADRDNGRASQIGVQNGASRQSVISLGPTDKANIIAHELGHAIEWHDEGVGEASQKFLRHRVGDEKLVSLNEATGTKGYRDDEVGRKDKFDQAFSLKQAYYIGKDYGKDATEVLSMALENIHDNPSNLARKDPEFFKFVFGVLRGEIR